MQYFTKQWMTGGLSDEEWEARSVAYRDRWREIEPLFTPGVHALVYGSPFGGFHDAVLIDARHGSDVRLTFCTGDLQNSYWTVELAFNHASVRTKRRSLARIVRGPFTELLYEEIDVDAGGYEWRTTYSDYTVVCIRFSDVRVTYEPRADRYWGRRPRSRMYWALRTARRPFIRGFWAVAERLERARGKK